jgi:lipoprotein-releasing system permease protein
MGMRSRQILILFISQGFALGLAGILVGLILGGISTQLIEIYQEHNSLISGSVYRISRIDLSIRGLDLVWIVGSTLLVSALSGLLPALRAAQKVPSQGLKYE